MHGHMNIKFLASLSHSTVCTFCSYSGIQIISCNTSPIKVCVDRMFISFLRSKSNFSTNMYPKHFVTNVTVLVSRNGSVIQFRSDFFPRVLYFTTWKSLQI